MRHFTLRCMTNGILFHAERTLGILNTLADNMSRFKLQKFNQISPITFLFDYCTLGMFAVYLFQLSYAGLASLSGHAIFHHARMLEFWPFWCGFIQFMTGFNLHNTIKWSFWCIAKGWTFLFVTFQSYNSITSITLTLLAFSSSLVMAIRYSVCAVCDLYDSI